MEVFILQTHDLCQYLKKIRVSKGKTIRDISESSGLTPAAIFNLESKHQNPKLDTLMKYLNAMDIKLLDVIEQGLNSAYDINQRDIFKIKSNATPVPKTKGVIWLNTRNKWRVCVRFNGKNIVLGYFDEFHEAQEVRLKADLDINKYKKYGKLPKDSIIRHESIGEDMYEVDKIRQSNVVGVNWDKRRNKWRARIKVNGKCVSLGSYSTMEEAEEARRQGEIKYFGNTIDKLYVKTPNKNNSSGVIGVHWSEARKVWISKISYLGKPYTLGEFKYMAVAENVRKRAEQEILNGTFLKWYNKKYHTASGKGRGDAKHIFVHNTNVGKISNTNAYANSKTGIRGVWWDKQQSKWRAKINFQKKPYELGLYNNIEDAMAARKIAEENIYGNFLEWYRKTYQW